MIVATGNIYEDRTAAVAAAEAGAQIIAVIRSTGQSLLDFVPYGPTTEGFGGTYATQANFAIMREALDEVSARLGRYVMLTNYASGLCMPEIAAMAALERLDMLLNDSMYGILFRDINMKRTFVDQHFSRKLNAASGIIINTGEDNYLTTADAVEQAPAVLASQFINEELAHRAGMPDRQIGLGDAYEIDPNLEDGFLLEVAQAQLARQIFPDAPLAAHLICGGGRPVVIFCFHRSAHCRSGRQSSCQESRRDCNFRSCRICRASLARVARAIGSRLRIV